MTQALLARPPKPWRRRHAWRTMIAWLAAGAAGFHSRRLIRDLADHATRIARGEHVVRHVTRHHASGPPSEALAKEGADHRARADPHAGQDDRPAAHPHGDERLTLRCPTFREGSGRPENFIAPGPVPSVLPSNVFDGRCSRRVSNPVTPSSIASSSRQVAAAGDPESRGLPTSGDRWVAL